MALVVCDEVWNRVTILHEVVTRLAVSELSGNEVWNRMTLLALVVCDEVWKEGEKATAVGREADKKVYEGIAFYSQQAANYSVIYDVWCD